MKRIFLLLVIFSLLSLVGGEVFAASLQIVTKNLPEGIVGLEYNQQVQAQGGTLPYAFSIKSGALPPGLNLSPDGKITGRPTKDGVAKYHNFSIRVVDGTAQVADQDFSIFIKITQLKITNPTGDTVPAGTVGEPYQVFTFGADGGIAPYVWGNPEFTGASFLTDIGLKLSPDGKISGVPVKSGNFKFAITVTGDPVIASSLNAVLKSFRIEIKSVPFEITTASPLSPGEAKSLYTATISAHGGTPPYSWSIAVGSLPPGLSLSTNNFFQGVISETSAQEGNSSFTVLVKDKDNKELAKQFSISIEKSCQCSDGTICGACKTGSPPLYCDGTTKTLINNPVCADGATTSPTPPPEKKLPSGKLEVNWPNSPMGTPLNDNSRLVDLIRYLYEWGIGLGGFAAFIALIIAGFQYLTSVGNAGKMGDAMKRMQSAGLGLVLLLGSFLVLNTINPQLTELKMPTIAPGEEAEGLKPIKPEKVDLSIKGCIKATLYSGPDYGGSSSITLYGPKDEKETLSQEVGSIKIEGSCQLILYKLTSFKENADNIPVVITGEKTPNVGVYGTTKFGSAKLTDLFFTPTPP